VGARLYRQLDVFPCTVGAGGAACDVPRMLELTKPRLSCIISAIVAACFAELKAADGADIDRPLLLCTKNNSYSCASPSLLVHAASVWGLVAEAW
jgi:hypothetical protein